MIYLINNINNNVKKFIEIEKADNIEWGKVKKFSGGKYRGNNLYIYNTAQVTNKGNKLYMRLSGANKYMIKKQWLFELDNYKEITFVEVLNLINKKYITNNPYPLGRHFHDALLYFYKENNLNLGYNKSILRDIKAKETNKNNFQYTLF